MMESKSIILKRDRRGRVRTPAQRQREAVAAYQRSGLSAKQFAAHCGIAYHTFWNWLRAAGLTQRRGGAVAAKGAPKLRLVEVAPTYPGSGGGSGGELRVVFAGGTQLVLDHAGQVALAAQLIKALTP